MFLEKFPYNIKIKNENYPKCIPSFIEVSQHSRMKYEWSHKKKALELDRVLHSAVFYPHNYGFIPQTLCGDGDALDVLVMTSEPLMPGTFCKVRPICHLIMEDEKGQDEKLLAVCIDDPYYNTITKKSDISEHVLKEISVFFETYKILEKKKWVKVQDWSNEIETLKLIQTTYDNYFSKPINLKTDL